MRVGSDGNNQRTVDGEFIIQADKETEKAKFILPRALDGPVMHRERPMVPLQRLAAT
jgi:hypothetical protein